MGFNNQSQDAVYEALTLFLASNQKTLIDRDAIILNRKLESVHDLNIPAILRSKERTKN